MKKITAILLCLWAICPIAYGQPINDSLQNKEEAAMVMVHRTDSLSNTPEFSYINPKRIGLYSAVLPGLGQAFNHHYWKIPVIYAGVAIAAYFIYDNQKNYNEFRSIYIGRVSNDPAAFQRHPELADLGQVQDAMEYYRKYLDLTIAFSVAGYAVQIIDAVVFANLRGFDISPDISLNLRPVTYPTGGGGLGLVMRFK